MVKVCNRKNVADHVCENLREFSLLDTLDSYNSEASLSDKTTRNLKFSNAKYHLACSLFCDGKRYAQCISNLTRSGKYYLIFFKYKLSCFFPRTRW